MREERYQGGIGDELKPDTSRAGVVDDGNIAWPERLVDARRQCMDVPAEDFERVGQRRWRDRGSGIEYCESGGASLLSVGRQS